MSTNDPLLQSIRTWMYVSRMQFWLVLILVLISFVVILAALVLLVTSLKKSHYFYFLISIIIADLTTLFIILVDIVSQSLFISTKGPLSCKLLLFVSNSAACFVNWAWLVMYLQRCMFLVFPFKRGSQGILGYIYNTKKLLIATAIFTTMTQSWSLVLITERPVRSEDGSIQASTCERDIDMLSDAGYKWVAIMEALTTYALPFLATMVVDLGVLFSNRKSTKFTLLTAESVRKYHASPSRLALTQPTHQDTYKIQSSQSIKSSTRRRQRAIRRCLAMATAQVLLNAPYYTLQMLDEIYMLQSTHSTMVQYLYADALLYLVYLLQFPMIIVYIFSLKADYKKPNRKTPTSGSFRYSTMESSYRSIQ